MAQSRESQENPVTGQDAIPFEDRDQLTDLAAQSKCAEGGLSSTGDLERSLPSGVKGGLSGSDEAVNGPVAASVPPPLIEHAVLCYVDGPWAYFTTKPLADQRGDDWDDAPYEHNAGEPYEPCWHNDPRHINAPTGRGLSLAFGRPLEPGELCRRGCCIDDWNEDGTPKWMIVRVAWEGSFQTPADLAGLNSRYSVDHINRGDIAWLTGDAVFIHAGVTLVEFIAMIRFGGGNVYLPITEKPPGLGGEPLPSLDLAPRKSGESEVSDER